MSTDPQTEKPTQVEGPTSHVDEALAKAEVQVESLESAPFSPTAFKLLVGSISEYAQDLTTESAKTARRHKLDTVSSTHVIQAQQYLVSSQRRPVFQHIGTIGGIFLGAALSNVLALLSSENITALSVLITAVLLVVGAFLVALHVGKDIK